MRNFTFAKGDSCTVEQLIELWCYCFPEDKTGEFLPWYFHKHYQADTTYTVLAGDRLAAVVYAPEVTLDIAGRSVTAGYIQGVAVAPDFRGQGLSKLALDYALEEIGKQGQALGILKPFEPDFYGRLGWSNFNYLLKYDLPLSRLAHYGVSSELDFVNLHSKPSYLPELQAVYQQWLAGVDVVCTRNHEGFTKLLEDHFNDGGEALLCYKQGQAVGYMLYRLEGVNFCLRELAYTQPVVLNSFLGIAASHSSQVKNLVAVLPDFPETRWLLPMTSKGANLFPFGMARITDVGQIFPLLTAPANLSCEFVLDIMDNQIEENNGKWLVKVDNGQVSASKEIPLSDKKYKNTLSLDIKLLTAMFTRCYNYCISKGTDFSAAGHENYQVWTWLEQIFPESLNYFYEYF